MPYQYKREPLTAEEATRLEQACLTPRQRLVIWTLLDTGLRISELASLRTTQIDWQGRRLMIYGKGGPYGTRSKRRIVPLSPRVLTLLIHRKFKNPFPSAQLCGVASTKETAGRWRRHAGMSPVGMHLRAGDGKSPEVASTQTAGTLRGHFCRA